MPLYIHFSTNDNKGTAADSKIYRSNFLICCDPRNEDKNVFIIDKAWDPLVDSSSEMSNAKTRSN